MKTLLCLALASLSFQSAHAAPRTLDADKSLPLIQSLVLAGVQPVATDSTYTITIKNLHCDAFFGGAGDGDSDLYYGMTEYNCSNPALTGANAKLAYDAVAAVATEEDCRMGKCRVDFKSLNCTIDRHAVENVHRFACQITE
ncbi:MAG: hypothetical protein ACXVB9_20850 [Bdellovibrionota bacterium]